MLVVGMLRPFANLISFSFVGTYGHHCLRGRILVEGIWVMMPLLCIFVDTLLEVVVVGRSIVVVLLYFGLVTLGL